jgi:hypothetical protein
MIELKAEHGSHDPAQVPWYLALGRHHYPNRQVDITYLTDDQASPWVFDDGVAARSPRDRDDAKMAQLAAHNQPASTSDG